MDEFGMGSAALNSAYGISANPWQDVEKEGVISPGGSSGGGAAAVASYLSHGSIGSDTGGSVRQPASFCGCVGLKPTYGLLSRHGLISYGSSMDCPGIMTRGVLDSVALLDVMSGYDCMDPMSIDTRTHSDNISLHLVIPQFLGHECAAWEPLKQVEGLLQLERSEFSLDGIVVGVPREFHTVELDSRILDIWNESLYSLQEAGATIKEISIPSLVSALPTYYMLACAEASSNLSRYDGIRYGYRASRSGHKGAAVSEAGVKSLASDLHEEISQTRGEAFGDEVLKRILTGTYVLSQSAYHDYYEKAMSCRNLICHELLGQLKGNNLSCDDGVDCFLGPTTPILPFYSSSPPNASAMYYNDILTVPANLAGLPAISVPAGVACREDNNTTEPLSMPVGMQIIGPRLGEGKIARIALAIEQRSKTRNQIPTMMK